MNILYLISDALSIITISMSLYLKVPQIMTLLKMQSAQGINLISLLMELASYSISATYNYVNGYSILSYLEYPIIILQEYVLIYLVIYYSHMLNRKAVISAICYCCIIAGFMLGILPKGLLMYLVPLTTPVSLSSKGIQLFSMLRAMKADTVSVTTWVISALTNCSRIYTIILDSGDKLLLTNFTLSTLMSSAIALTAYYLKKVNRVDKQD